MCIRDRRSSLQRRRINPVFDSVARYLRSKDASPLATVLSLSFLPFVIKQTSAVASLFLAMGCQPAPSPDPPLVLLVAVDQLRGDMLQAFAPVFTGGLRRILDEGLRFENGTHDHAATATAPGHHTLSTGVHPTRHGVVGNEWLEPVSYKHLTLPTIYSV